jgi:cytochrome c-type biogenesis protein CcmH
MMLARAAAIALAVCTVASPAFASEAKPTLAELETEVVCPTCHTTLDQSSAPVADRLRAFIRVRIAAGDTKSEIKDKLVAQFGEQVLAAPPKRGFNLLAWVLPPAAGIAAAAVVGVLAVRWSRRLQTPAGEDVTDAGTPEIEKRIDDELARFDV